MTNSSAATAGLTHGDPPKLHLIAKQNLGYNALRDVCGIPENDTMAKGELASALNGRGRLPGIRALVWGELVDHHFNGDAESARAVCDAEPERFERAVAAMIERRAERYTQVFSDETILTPTALRKWWLRLDTLARRARGGLTPDDMRRLGV